MNFYRSIKCISFLCVFATYNHIIKAALDDCIISFEGTEGQFPDDCVISDCNAIEEPEKELEPSFEVKADQFNKVVKCENFNEIPVKLFYNNNSNLFYSNNLKNVQEVYFRNCHISPLDFLVLGHMKNLKEIHCIECKIDLIPPGIFWDFLFLETIVFFQCSIGAIYPVTFCNLPLLKSVYIEYSNITHLDPDIFRYLPKLKILSLCDNELSSFNFNIFESKMPKLNTINLMNNPLESISEEASYSAVPPEQFQPSKRFFRKFPMLRINNV